MKTKTLLTVLQQEENNEQLLVFNPRFFYGISIVSFLNTLSLSSARRRGTPKPSLISYQRPLTPRLV